MSVPYATANASNARGDITKILRRFGCESIGFMDDYTTGEVLLAFTHRGVKVQLRASGKGWAQLFLKENPHSGRMKSTRVAYERAALEQGHRATSSILRDWIKGQVTAVECGILSFEAVFMPFMLTADGRPLLDRLKEHKLLPEPEDPKVVNLK